MDFIERLFGVAPDGGDGSLEVAWLGAAAVVVLAIIFRRRVRALLSSRSALNKD